MTRNGVWAVTTYRDDSGLIWGHISHHKRVGYYDWQINPDGIHYYNQCRRLIPAYVQEMILRMVALIKEHPEYDNEQVAKYMYDY